MAQKDKVEIAEEYFKKAYSAHLKGDLPVAIEAYKISIDYNPTAKAYTFLGWAYSLQGKFDEAIEQCKIAISIDPSYGNPYNDIGSYLISLKKYDEAIDWLEKAIKAPDYEPRHYPYYNLGNIYEKKGDWFTALNYYNESLAIDPNYDSAKTAVIRLTSLLN